MKNILHIITGSILLFSVLLIWFPGTYDLFTLDNHLVDYLSFAIFLISGILVIKSAHQTSPLTYKVFLLLAAMGFIIVAIQEMHWGQQLFAVISQDTLPDNNSPKDWSSQIHTVAYYHHLMDALTITIVILTMIADVLGKNSFGSLPLPSSELFKSLAITTFYREYDLGYIDFNMALIPGLIIILFQEIRNRRYKRINSSIITLTIITMLIAVHSLAAFNFPDHYCGAIEVRELLLAICCLGYGVQLKRV